MRVWTVHTAPAAAPIRPARAPVLVREGFSWGAFLFSLPWLLLHRLWLTALLWVAGALALMLLLPAPTGVVAVLAGQFLLGCHAPDLRRWGLRRRGYDGLHLVAERDEDRAVARLLETRPELVRAWARASLA